MQTLNFDAADIKSIFRCKKLTFEEIEPGIGEAELARINIDAEEQVSFYALAMFDEYGIINAAYDIKTGMLYSLYPTESVQVVDFPKAQTRQLNFSIAPPEGFNYDTFVEPIADVVLDKV